MRPPTTETGHGLILPVANRCAARCAPLALHGLRQRLRLALFPPVLGAGRLRCAIFLLEWSGLVGGRCDTVGGSLYLWRKSSGGGYMQAWLDLELVQRQPRRFGGGAADALARRLKRRQVQFTSAALRASSSALRWGDHSQAWTGVPCKLSARWLICLRERVGFPTQPGHACVGFFFSPFFFFPPLAHFDVDRLWLPATSKC